MKKIFICFIVCLLIFASFGCTNGKEATPTIDPGAVLSVEVSPPTWILGVWDSAPKQSGNEEIINNRFRFEENDVVYNEHKNAFYFNKIQGFLIDSKKTETEYEVELYYDSSSYNLQQISSADLIEKSGVLYYRQVMNFSLNNDGTLSYVLTDLKTVYDPIILTKHD